MANILSMLDKHSLQQPQQTAFLFLEDGESESARINYSELEKRASVIAGYLQRNNMYGKRILLLYPAGIDFIISFIGCLYAGAIAVPVACPKPGSFNESESLLKMIAIDADIAGIFTNKNLVIEAKECFSKWIPDNNIFVMEANTIKPSKMINHEIPRIDADTIAYLQYTSGSTSSPKAAIVRHENLTHSLTSSAKVWRYNKKSVTFTWAPHTHVYGLVCGLLLPLYHGTPSIMMPVEAFIRRPILWLRAISKYQVTHSGCPNFGYTRCITHIDEVELTGINLQSWKVAINGGEKVQSQTLTQFNNKFKSYGFKPKQFNSAFGMSEASGAISVGKYAQAPIVFSIDKTALQNNQVKMTTKVDHLEFVSNGQLLPGLSAIAVDPDTLTPVVDGKIGEIWLRGKSIVSGYWRREEETRAIFHATFKGDSQHYFRSGDLGFIHDNEICLTGRLKELIVVHGKKYYPQDMEAVIANTLSALSINESCAVFSLTEIENEKVIVVQEINPDIDRVTTDKMHLAIRNAINREFGIDLHAVIFVGKNTLPKTTSGKLQRKLCEKYYLENKFNIISLYSRNEGKNAAVVNKDVIQNQDDFRGLLSTVLRLNPDKIDFQAPLSNFGLDSINIIHLISLLNEQYALTLSPAILYEYQTLNDFYNDIIANKQAVINKTTVNMQSINANDIAIIGMSGIFPNANDVNDFWNNLINGKNAITEIPAERWNWRTYNSEPHKNLQMTVSKWGGFIDNIDCFDAGFFNISPLEAELIDPQQRIFLEVVWKTIEDAGYSASSIAKLKAGLYVGVFNHDYTELLHKNAVAEAYMTTGTATSMLANRVSYLLNLQGPSEVIDTACSSSLVAIHHAVRAIQNGDCEIAIAGGVNALLTPTSFITASKAGMLSQDGQCKTFDSKANGFVRGEGSAAILIKRLDKALSDHDHIYGVIKGTAINHGGHVNSLTAPNPNAQADVIIAAHALAKVPIESISYVETHGTGTALGDPIEINGLKKAFKLLAEEQGKQLPSQFCGLGAVKTNIGHLESAAGIAGLIKVLLSIKHEQIPPNLNFSELNPYISMSESPFYLINDILPWKRLSDGTPRRAGVSSFGFGGTNAHIIVEEPPRVESRNNVAQNDFYLVALSAKTESGLARKISELRVWLDNQAVAPSLSALSYTLNTGRMHFDKRCCLVVASIESLQRSLDQLQKGTRPDNFIDETNCVDNEIVMSELERVDLNLLSKSEYKNHLMLLAKHYVARHQWDWNKIHADQNGSRISMPTYPFAKERYWVPSKSLVNDNEVKIENLYTNITQEYSQQLTGKESYLIDHKIKDDHILPGAFYIEMARVIVNHANPENQFNRLQNIKWIKPLKYVNSTHLTMSLSDTDSSVEFVAKEAGSGVCATGEIYKIDDITPPSPIDIKFVTQYLTNKHTSAEIYSDYAAIGLHYGQSFQVIQHAISNDTEVFATIKAPKQLGGNNTIETHISVLDGALHTAMLLLLDKQSLFLPRQIAQIDFYNDISSVCFAHVKLLPEFQSTRSPVFNIQLIDMHGNIIVDIKEFMVSAIQDDTTKRIYCYRPSWEPVAINESVNSRLDDSKPVLLFDHNDKYKELQKLLPAIKILSVQSSSEYRVLNDDNFLINTHQLADYINLFTYLNEHKLMPSCIIYATDLVNLEQMTEVEIQQQLQQTYHAVFYLSKALLQVKPTAQIQILFANKKVNHKESSLFLQALPGFAKTLNAENPNVCCRLIEYQSMENLLLEFSQQAFHVRYDNYHQRQVLKYQEVISHTQVRETFKQNGVYLLTGGMGGIGLIIARYLTGQYNAKLILTGRSPLDAKMKAVIDELNQADAEAIYIQADISSSANVHKLLQTGKSHFGMLNGIIHVAGATNDGFIINKHLEDSISVFAPKINGTIHLDEATQNEPLDFFILFSSVASIFGNAGQCDYSYANHFMDCFAGMRENLRKEGKRQGKTVSINWPLWHEGGIQIDAVVKNQLEQSLGIIPLTTDAGIEVLNKAIGLNHSQLIILPGNKFALEQALLASSLGKQRIATQGSSQHFSGSNDDYQKLQQKTSEYLRQLFSKIIKIKPDRVQDHVLFETYGIDSLMIIQLNQHLENDFDTLPKTLFYEYQSLSALTEYFIKNHFEKLMKILRLDNIKHADLHPVPSPTLTQVKQPMTNHSTLPHSNDIAIIGISGRYPKANSIDEFWQNLKSGRDCISEIPAERWDQNKYFDTDKSKSGKIYSNWGGFIDDVDQFDPLFFNISPHDAELMDPQERLFLQTAWSTIEDAGYAKESLTGKNIGLFVGVMYGQYQLFGVEEALNGNNVPTNSVFSSIANRVSYYFDFHGPSIALDTMCSSSLTSLHLACQSIRNGECEMALAGGVNLSIHPNKYLLLSQGKFLSTDGRCRSFGEGGDGYVPGEGVGAVLLKPLSQALSDGDHIYGVIKGSSINHGGKSNGYTVPNPIAQAAVIAQAYRQANLDPSSVSYLEAHGTGTSLGDPIEIAGLGKVFHLENRDQAYTIGSVKSNIGHCESAAGIAAVTKILMQMKYKQYVPSLYADRLNNNIDWSANVFKVQQELCEWARPTVYVNGAKTILPRIAGISSFGAGGSNAHIVIQEAPDSPVHQIKSVKPSYLLVLSAKTKEGLFRKISDLISWMSNHENEFVDDISLENISYTLNTGRSHFETRCAMVVDSIGELIQTLQALKSGEEPLNTYINVSGRDKNRNQIIIKKIYQQLIHDLNQSLQTSSMEYRENLLALASFYVDGYDFEFTKLHAGESNRKISLPTYPFARERYWYNTVNTQLHSLMSANSMKDHSVSSLTDKIKNSLARMIAEQIKIEVGALDAKKNLSEYGMDSVQFVKFANHISDYYKIQFTPALFYTCNSLTAISAHLVDEYFEAVTKTHNEMTSAQTIVHSDNQLHLPSTRRNDENQQDIAIIGVQGLFPQSSDVQTFWDHLVSGHDLVTEIPSTRWNWHQFYSDTKKQSDKTDSKWGAFIDCMDTFDASFFNISTREAQLMDPQQRLFLEVAWKAIEDAGYDPHALSAQKVGVFAGVEFSEYHVLIANQHKEFHGYIATGNSHSMIANRVSYFLNLQGPSESVDTACSSSLVAIHRAVHSINQGECSLAIAGGVSLILNPDTYIVTSQLGALSPDGRCKTFDKSANGYVKGEGVGAVLLKPLTQALNDGDYIYGVIKATAVNHGGKAQSLTAPNAIVQSDLIVNAYSKANINPATVTYIETHGTGTVLGDPAEIEGLKHAFKKLLPHDHQAARIGLGSVKTNIGHLEPASGIASVAKVLYAIRHGKLPGNVHLKEVNPYIDLANSPFYILSKTQSWEKIKNTSGEHIPYRAGISSFGFGGTNAHIVIEQSPLLHNQQIQTTKPYYLFTMSAKQTESLQQKLIDLHTWLTQNRENVNLHSLSFTLNTGRTHFEKRCAIVVKTVDELINNLRLLYQNQQPEHCFINKDKAQTTNHPLSSEIDDNVSNQLKNLDALNQDNYLKTLLNIAELYCKQHTIDWSSLYQHDQCFRVTSLPVYPFLKKRYWFDCDGNVVSETKTEINNKPDVDLHEYTVNYLQTIFAEKLRIPSEQIEIDKTYEIYGVDSLTGLEITTRLENDFGTLPKTLLYEQNTIQDLSSYFIKKHAHILQAKFASTSDSIVSNENHARLSMITSEKTIAIANTTNKKEYLRSEESNDIAIIGLSGVFPMASDINEFWQNLLNGRDCIGEIPPDRWDYRDHPVKVGGEEKYFRFGGFISDVDKFDPLFFNISPHDATIMDPQERLFLQSSWSTLEDAGYTRDKLQQHADNEVGVFAGITYNYYPLLIAEERKNGNQLPIDLQTFSVANRVSYFLNLTGPSFVIDTACSSSLAAIHQACESLLRKECKMAIAGGVNLSLHPSKFHFLGSFNFMSDQGRCTSFAEGGTGYVPSEGLGTVLLKPLSSAIKDNDRIYGVIKASSMNHGGKTSGYTVPNPNAQASVIQSAIQKANIDPRTITYIEAHGTGTALGDPIEIRGLQDAFEQRTQDKQFCAIGSVKSNIGHLESAAGISQLAKVLMQLRHKKLVPSIHAEKLNPFIDFSQTPFYVQRQLSNWQPENNVPRRAGISSFGAGGANVHMIVEEYVGATSIPAQMQKAEFLYILSAMNADRLQEYIKLVYEYLIHEKKQHTNDIDTWLYNVCYTSQTGRENMSSRLAIVATSYEDLINKIRACIDNPTISVDRVWINHSVKFTKPNVDLTQILHDANLVRLAELWISGSPIPWSKLYQSQQPSIVSLPTYPFAKRRCWAVKQPASVQIASEPLVEKPQLSLVENKVKCEAKWLIFSDKETGFLLQDEFDNQSCLYCFAGEKFEQVQNNAFYINPDSLDDYANLLNAVIARKDVELKGMIYLWTLGQDVIENASRVNQRLLYLIQTIIQQKWQHEIQFCLVRRDSKLQTDIQQLDTLQHHLWNLSDYFSREKQAHLISLISLEDKTKLREQAKLIAYDVLNMVKTENHVCYTSSGRETKQLINPDSFAAHEAQQQPSSVKKIRSDVILEKEYLSNLVMNSLASLLGLEIVEIDPDVPYLNYGMDSIRGINFIANLNEYFADLLLPMDLYRYPNVSQLVSYIQNSFEPEIKEENNDAAKSSSSMQSESEFMSEIADLSDAEVSKLLEEELLDIDNLLLGS